MVTPSSAISQYDRQQQIAAVTVASMRRLALQLGDDFDAGWWRLRARAEQTLQLGRAAAIHAAVPYTSSVLAETRQPGVPVGAIVPAGFLAAAPNGEPVLATLDALPVKAKNAVAGGATSLEARIAAASWLGRVAMTMLADTSRDVYQADMISRPQVTGYVRMVAPGACSRCIILAGKRFLWNQGFQRHPNCFPAGVVVNGPSVDAAARRWYEGELVTLTTASGQELPVTGNHPILTSRGWVPANLIKEGDYVVRSTQPEGATPLVIPDHNQVPSLIEDVWSSLSVNGLERVPTTAEDFHGDGQDGEVSIVHADSSLLHGGESSLGEHLEELGLALGVAGGISLGVQGVSELGDLWNGAHSCSTVGGSDLELALIGGSGFVALNRSISGAATLGAGLGENLGDYTSADSVLSGESVFGRAGGVLLNDLGSRHGVGFMAPRWDAPGRTFSGESVEGYARVGSDLLRRLSGQVELDRVVHAVSRDFSGHVYSLTSSEGWHVANSLIVSNCNCRHIPASEALAGDMTTDPYAHFKSLSEGQQDRVFGKHNAQAIRDGADIYRVENIRMRGLGTAAGNKRFGTPNRRTIEDIYSHDRDRKFVIENLRYHGYITGPQTAGGNILGNDPAGRILAAGRGRGTYTVGGQIVTTGRAARYDALVSGTRDPLNRATMTATERRLFDAHYRAQWADAGYRPNTIGANSADRGLGLRPITPEEASRAASTLRQQVAIAADPTQSPESVRELARILGVL